MSKVLLMLLIMLLVLFVLAITSPRAHEYGHAEGIYHLNKGERTGRIEKYGPCYAGPTRQNKIVLYIDEDRDGIVEECATIWMEHGKMHYIRSLPDLDGVCECKGYIWLYNDSQEGK